METDDATAAMLIRYAAIDGLFVMRQREQAGIEMDRIDGRDDRVKTREANLAAIDAAMDRVQRWNPKVER